MGTLTRYAFALGVITLSSQLLSAQQPWDWGFGHAGHIWDIATDADGYSYVVGHAYDTVGFMGVQTDPGGGFLAKVSPTGSMIWTQTFTNAIFLEIELKNDLLYATGEGETNVVVGSHSFFVDPGQGWACLVASFDTTGNDLWVNCLRSPEDISANDLDVNDAGELFIAGTGREAIYTNTDTLYLNSPWAQVLILKYALVVASNGSLPQAVFRPKRSRQASLATNWARPISRDQPTMGCSLIATPWSSDRSPCRVRTPFSSPRWMEPGISSG
ncbi:MAG: hypothetical protein IPI07_05305 [Flavobacteriales bacterium]|nr:hypothetical protein [Flavobacteriales bacterium]